MLKIHSIETFWTHEWPGIRVVFFMQWCKMHCLYCHNPDTITQIWWKKISFDEIIKTVNKSKAYFWSKWWVTFSGWECFIQAKELIPVFQELKKLWFHIAVDTNWFIFDEYVEKLLEFTDLVLLDIKHLYDEDHKKLTWVSNKNILKFANYLEKNKIQFWIRHVLVPNWTDSEKHLEDLGFYFKNFKYLERLEILPYHTLWVYKWKEMWLPYWLEWVEPPTSEELLKAKLLLEKNLKNVLIRR